MKYRKSMDVFGKVIMGWWTSDDGVADEIPIQFRTISIFIWFQLSRFFFDLISIFPRMTNYIQVWQQQQKPNAFKSTYNLCTVSQNKQNIINWIVDDLNIKYFLRCKVHIKITMIDWTMKITIKWIRKTKTKNKQRLLDFSLNWRCHRDRYQHNRS